ncbi:MAG TPA: peptide ABC transporter substrate-binding protein [Trebonia sp.]|jgi:peptide/nickel transport system substrate-binding protein|nr:peptide ABC transporter substrate-binding protein [Trebonia sp.]
MRTSRRLAIAAVMAATAIGLAACSGSGGSSAIGTGSGTAATGQKVQGGTVTVAWPDGSAPNLIFPLPAATNTDGYDINFTQNLWPTLVSEGDGAQSAVDPQESLYSSLAYSNGDKTVTIKLKPWKWSDGTPITSRDFTFVYNLLKANVPNWIGYTQGLFPDDVKSVQTPNSSTVVLNLTRSYNPDFYTEDVLSEIPLLPQHAWDKESATGKVGNYDETTAGAKAVWNFLQKEGSDMPTFTTNPLWKVVDGPFTLASFSSDGDYTYVPNKNFSGTVPAVSQVVNEQFTSDTSELDALRSGGSLTVGQLPQNDIQQIGILKTEGYDVVNQAIPGVAGTLVNFYNAQTGPLVSQLYVRQAMEDLIDRPQIVSKVYGGYADPGNGPVPTTAFSQWASPVEKSGGPYPYDPAKAVSLLKAHGWKVTPGGTSTCQSPGTGATECGTGIAKGEALSFQLLYSAGSTTGDEMEAAIQSSEEQAGIKFGLKSEPFNTLSATVGQCTASSHPAATCGWQLVDYGYDPYDLYPAGNSIFNTDGVNNLGGYSSTEENTLINETEYGASSQAFSAYEDYTAEQLPWLWVPQPSTIEVYKSNLGGFAPLNPFSGGINPEDWYFTK